MKMNFYFNKAGLSAARAGRRAAVPESAMPAKISLPKRCTAGMKESFVKRSHVRMVGLVVVATLLGLAGRALLLDRAVRSTTDADATVQFAERDLQQVLKDYAGRTVLASIERAEGDIAALDAAAARLRAEPTDERLQQAAAAWRTARFSWKMTKIFEFGPSAQYNFDKQLASWPVDTILVDHLLAEARAGRLHLTPEVLRTRLYATQRGFYAAEYLLFRDGRPRRAEDLGPAELEYLTAVTGAMVIESTDYEAAWRGTQNLATGKAEQLARAGLPRRVAYAEEFINPGAPGSRYFSASSPLQELLQDGLAVVEDMCPAIEASLGSDDPLESETWFSRNALADFQAELQGVGNAYLGGVEGRRGASVSGLLATRNPVLDRRIRIALADLAYRLSVLGDAPSQDPRHRDLEVRRAASSCGKLASRFTAAIPVIALDPGARPWAAYGR